MEAEVLVKDGEILSPTRKGEVGSVARPLQAGLRIFSTGTSGVGVVENDHGAPHVVALPSVKKRRSRSRRTVTVGEGHVMD